VRTAQRRVGVVTAKVDVIVQPPEAIIGRHLSRSDLCEPGPGVPDIARASNAGRESRHEL
jgi:hypothetical protein